MLPGQGRGLGPWQALPPAALHGNNPHPARSTSLRIGGKAGLPTWCRSSPFPSLTLPPPPRHRPRSPRRYLRPHRRRAFCIAV